MKTIAAILVLAAVPGLAFAATPIAETESYAMMLSGLSLMAMVAARRLARRNG